MLTLILVSSFSALLAGLAVYAWFQKKLGTVALLEAEQRQILNKLEEKQFQCQQAEDQLHTTQAQLQHLQQQHTGLHATHEALKHTLEEKQAVFATEQQEQYALNERLQTLQQEHAALQAAYTASQESTVKQEAQFKTLWETQLQQFLQRELEQTYERMNRLNVAEDEERQGKLASLMQPVQEMLNQYQQKLQAMDETYKQQTHLIKSKVDDLTLAKQELVSVLKHNKGAGDWGELQLLRLLELSGLKADVHYTFQPTIAVGKRPDVKVFLPQERYVIIDSKAMQVSTRNLQDFERATASLQADVGEPGRENAVVDIAGTGTETDTSHKALVKSIRTAVDDLHRKNYTQGRVNETPNFVVLFLPQESMLANALEHDPALWETAWQKQVLLSSPLTLIALLRMIHAGWNQHKLTENMLAVMELGKKVHERVVRMADRFITVEKRFDTLGKGLKDLKSSLEGQQGLVKASTELKELGVDSGKALPKELEDAADRLVMLDEATNQEESVFS
jgi:DNA recombination protein RmuC